MLSAADLLRIIATKTDPDVVVKKFRPAPGAKPARRRPTFQNLSDRSTYHRDYKRRQREEGKDYQKVPEDVKTWRREQRKRLELKGLHTS